MPYSTIDLFNNAISSKDIGMVQAAVKPAWCSQVLLAIGDFFSDGDATRWYNTKYNIPEIQCEIAKVFAQAVSVDLTQVVNNTLECQFDDGTKISFEAHKGRVRGRIGNEVKEIDGVTDLVDFQQKILADVKKDIWVYTEKGANIDLHAFTRDFEQKLSSAEVTKSEKVRGGILSTVTKLSLENREPVYFKPIEDMGNNLTTPLVSGISKSDNRFAERSKLTYVMSEILGFGVIPQTGLYNRMPDGTNSAPLTEEAGYAQQQAGGANACSHLQGLHQKGKLDSIKAKNELIRQLVELQLLDALTGQVDRHHGNYFIDEKTGKVMGIDNDASWGAFVTHPHNMMLALRTDGYWDATNAPEVEIEFGDNKGNRVQHQLTPDEKKVVDHLKAEGITDPIPQLRRDVVWLGRTVFLPPVMDVNMVEKFKKLDGTMLANWMDQFGFTDEEKTAAGLRLDAIQFHISVLEKRQAQGIHSIINPNEWSSTETAKRLFPQQGNPGNALAAFTSYLHRDMAIAGQRVADYKRPDWVREAQDQGYQYP